MRIAINCRSFLKRQYTGIGRYAYHLVKCLSDIDRENQYILYARKGLFSFNKRLPRFPSNNFRICVDWLNRGLPGTVKGVDVCHYPSPCDLNAPSRAKIVVTVHDVIFKAFAQGHTAQTIREGERQYAELQHKADKIICCSQSTIRDLQRFFPVPPDKIRLIYQGVDRNVFYPFSGQERQAARRKLKDRGIEVPFILSVGTIEPRKNLHNLIRAFHLLKSSGRFKGKLVIAGMKGWMHENISGLVKEHGLARDIIFPGFLSDRDLCFLYNNAEVFVFPSFYEGFGFPIVEAFCCGVPVVTSNVSSCPEVAGDAALAVDPNSPEVIASAITRVLDDPAFAQTLREQGIRRAREFDFMKTARQTLEVYKEVCR